jgi:ABC-2 type transport system permease protein
LKRYLQYPVELGRVYVLGLASGIVGDPLAAFWLVLLAGGFAGAALGRFGLWLLPLAAVFAGFAAATVALVALLQEGFARLARWRYFRELAMLTGVAGWALLLSASRLRLASLLPVLRQVQWILFPPGLAAAAARKLYAGQILAALSYLAGLWAAAAAVAWLAYRLALATALSGGEEGRAPTGAAGVPVPRFLPEALGPLFEKELRYLVRHPVARVSLAVVPAMAGFIAWQIIPRLPEEAGDVVRSLPLFGVAAYVHLVVQVFWLNAFAWDRGGARTFFSSPATARQVLAAKNAATALLAAALFVAATAVFVAVAGRPPAWALLGGIALHAGLGPVVLGLGNVVSIVNPRAAPYALQRGGSLPALSSLAGMAIISGATAIFGLPVLLALRLDAPWLLVSIWTAMALAAWLAWWRTLSHAGRILTARKDVLLAEVCGDSDA